MFNTKNHEILLNKELVLINQLMDRCDINNPVIAQQLIENCQARGTFKTEIGLKFLDLLQETVDSAENNNITTQTNQNGNTNSNLTNRGLVVSDSNFVYFCNSESEIYKMNVDRTEIEKLNDDVALYLNLIGDYLYYIGVVEGSHKLIKMKIDGSEYEIIHGKRCLFANVIGEWIYFVELIDGEYEGYVCKIKLDGSSYTRLNQSKQSSDLNIVGDWIYYKIKQIGSFFSEYQIYRVKNDGNNEQLFCDLGLGYTDKFIATEEFLYLSSSEEIIVLNHDGAVLKKLKIPCNYLYAFCVQDDWIYYFGEGNDEVISICKINLSSLKSEKLIDVRNYDNSSLFVSSEWLYYTASVFIKKDGIIDKFTQLFRLKTDGTNHEKCVDDLSEQREEVMKYSQSQIQISELESQISKIINENYKKINLTNEQYRKIVAPLSKKIVTNTDISQLTLLLNSIKPMLNEVKKASDLLSRLNHLDVYDLSHTNYEEVLAIQEEYASDMTKILSNLIEELSSIKNDVNSSSKGSSANESSSLLNIVLLTGLQAFLKSTKPSYKMDTSLQRPTQRYTSRTKTGRKMGR